MNDADIDRRLRAADRAHAIAGGTLDALAVAAQREARTSRRRRLTAIGMSALLVVGGGAVAAPAAADAVREFLAQSDWFPAAGGEILPDSEWVDLEAGDLREYIEFVYPEYIPIPPSMTRDEIIDRTYEIWNQPDATTQEVSLRRSVETFAYCGWAVELIDAQRDGDAGRYDRAAQTVLAAAEWPALVATDGGGITAHLREVGTAALKGERGSWWDVYAAGECDILDVDAGAAQ
jgi:hypothetical protein